jgi:hypothetical protein
LIGVFRDVDISNRAITYIEFKADSTAILKKINLRQNDTTKKAFALNGQWKMNKDTVILDFGRVLQDSHLYYNNEPQIKLLVKNSNALYNRRSPNGKFITDSILKKANKLVRLRPEFLYEYSDLPD